MSSWQHECETHAAAGALPGPGRRHPGHRAPTAPAVPCRGSAGNTDGRAPPAPQDLMIYSRQPPPVPSSVAVSARGGTVPNAGTTISSNSTPNGRWTGSPTGPSGGPRRPGEATPRSRPATRSESATGPLRTRTISGKSSVFARITANTAAKPGHVPSQLGCVWSLRASDLSAPRKGGKTMNDGQLPEPPAKRRRARTILAVAAAVVVVALPASRR